MRLLWTVPLLLVSALCADEASDRRAIEGVIARLNFTDERAGLFASGADVPAELHRLGRVRCNMTGEPRVWSEVPSPRFTRPTVQFLATDLALADTEYLQFHSVVAAVRTPVVVILKRERSEWKIVTLRVMAECPGVPRIVPAAR
jgi:hypothetical protein